MYIKVVLAYLRVSSRPVSKGSRDRGATEEGSGQSVILIRTWPLPSPSTQGRVYRAKTSKEGRGVSERSGGRSADFKGDEASARGRTKDGQVERGRRGLCSLSLLLLTGIYMFDQGEMAGCNEKYLWPLVFRVA